MALGRLAAWSVGSAKDKRNLGSQGIRMGASLDLGEVTTPWSPSYPGLFCSHRLQVSAPKNTPHPAFVFLTCLHNFILLLTTASQLH